ncbi:MAG: glucosamine-6-phosphate deaminase [Defluviitaleaceae bacterium]|nr:glucosamine-6-phosphate deaminase [Defluviitaleaceae bacterium]
MNIIVCKDYDILSKKASDFVSKEIKENPKLVLGLATGASPLGMYKNLIEMHKSGQLDFSCVTTFNLDEYASLAPTDPNSYNYYMKTNFFEHVNIDQNKTFLPNGQAPDLQKECKKYHETIQQAGGIDLQVLGIGSNAHIGFNEPGLYFEKTPFVTDLAEETIKANAQYFDNKEQMPKQAITMGIGNIMEAKKILLLSSGKKKANAIYSMVHGKIDPQIPASILGVHNNVTIIIDEDAAHLL